MKEYTILFITYYEQYLEICLGFKKEKRFDDLYNINKSNIDSLKSGNITKEEFNILDADNFTKYLKILGKYPTVNQSNICNKCNGVGKPSKALYNTHNIQTQDLSKEFETKLINCIKCENCGHSWK